MLKLKKTKKGWSASRGLMFFDAVKVLGGIEIKARHQGMEFRLEAKSIAEAERKIAAWIEAAHAETMQDRLLMMQASNERWAAQDKAQAQGCTHEWVDQVVTDHLNIVSHSKCSKCGELKTVPRSN